MTYRSTAEEISNYEYMSKEKSKMDLIREHHYESKTDTTRRRSPSPVPGQIYSREESVLNKKLVEQ
jgi:hypothetical protein